MGYTCKGRWVRKAADKRRKEEKGVYLEAKMRVGDGFNKWLSEDRTDHADEWTAADLMDVCMEFVEYKRKLLKDPMPPKQDLPPVTKAESKLIEREEKEEGYRNRFKRLDFVKAQEIRKAHTEGIAADFLAVEYDVSIAAIYAIIANRSWKE